MESEAKGLMIQTHIQNMQHKDIYSRSPSNCKTGKMWGVSKGIQPADKYFLWSTLMSLGSYNAITPYHMLTLCTHTQPIDACWGTITDKLIKPE